MAPSVAPSPVEPESNTPSQVHGSTTVEPTPRTTARARRTTTTQKAVSTVEDEKSTKSNYLVFWFIISVIVCLFCLLAVCACGEASQKMSESSNSQSEDDNKNITPVIHKRTPEEKVVLEVKSEEQKVVKTKRTKKSKLTKAIERKKAKSTKTTTESLEDMWAATAKETKSVVFNTTVAQQPSLEALSPGTLGFHVPRCEEPERKPKQKRQVMRKSKRSKAKKYNTLNWS